MPADRFDAMVQRPRAPTHAEPRAAADALFPSDQASASQGEPARRITRSDADRARSLRLLASRRETAFGAGLFFDPAWHMLLDLFICEADRKLLSVSGVCVGVSAASATALRYLALLENGGLVERLPDPADGRRSFVHLTDLARLRMATVLATLP